MTSSDIAVVTQAGHVLPEDVLGPVRVSVARSGGAPLFVGSARRARSTHISAGAAHADVDDITGDPPRYVTRVGGTPRG
jgi:hypothetical protein